jgi:putative SOS response-associated peptidase YedK
VPVIVHNDGVNELKPMKWGLVPPWSPDPSIGNHMINARAETITEKLSYRRLVESKRCLIPADCFYEWRREGNRKVPIWHLKNKQPFAFAGLWEPPSVRGPEATSPKTFPSRRRSGLGLLAYDGAFSF